jgi:hypothetical protein
MIVPSEYPEADKKVRAYLAPEYPPRVAVFDLRRKTISKESSELRGGGALDYTSSDVVPFYSRGPCVNYAYGSAG